MTYVEINEAKFELVPMWWNPKTQQYVGGATTTEPKAHIAGYLLKPLVPNTILPAGTVVSRRPLVGQL